MKKISLTIISICLVAHSSTAQNFYLKAGAGYAFPMPGHKFDQNANPINVQLINKNGPLTYEVKNASFSSGLQTIVGAGYLLSQNLGIELDANLNITSPTYTYAPGIGMYDPFPINHNITYVSSEVSRHATNTLLVMPSLVMQTSSSLAKVYTRIGVVLPLNTRIRQLITIGSDQYSWEMNHYFSLGFTSAAGVKVRMNNHVCIFGELSMLYLSPARKELNLEFAEINGATLTPSMLKNIPTSVTYDNSGIISQRATMALPQPFSNLSASLGVHYQLKAIKKAQKS